MTNDEKKALVDQTGVVTLNGFPAKLLGWRNEQAQVVCFPGVAGRQQPAIKEAFFSWEDAARIVAKGGEFATKEPPRSRAPGSSAAVVWLVSCRRPDSRNAIAQLNVAGFGRCRASAPGRAVIVGTVGQFVPPASSWSSENRDRRLHGRHVDVDRAGTFAVEYLGGDDGAAAGVGS